MRGPVERERVLAALRSFALMVAPLTAALATQWILDGAANTLMPGARDEARVRQKMALDVLAGRYARPGDGLHLWGELPTYWRSYQIAQAAERERAGGHTSKGIRKRW